MPVKQAKFGCILRATIKPGYTRTGGEKVADVWGVVEGDSFTSTRVAAESKVAFMLSQNDDIVSIKIEGPYELERLPARAARL